MHGGDVVGMVFFLVVGIVVVTYIYFRSREKQLMIEKGLSFEQMAEFLKTKKDPYGLLKLGILLVLTGIGISTGVLIAQHFENTYGNGDQGGGWVVLCVFLGLGLGFIGAYLAGRIMEKHDAKK